MCAKVFAECSIHEFRKRIPKIITRDKSSFLSRMEKCDQRNCATRYRRCRYI